MLDACRNNLHAPAACVGHGLAPTEPAAGTLVGYAERCGRRPNKSLVGTAEMIDRIKSCVDARTEEAFFIVARTDSLANEGLSGAIDGACAYMEAGADLSFAEACSELSQYPSFVDALDRPHSVLANITEFSMTPSFTLDELREAGVSAAR
jgi:methylisocitrate lyase